MLEAAEVGHKVGKADYRERLPELRESLLRAQYELREADFPLIVLLTGDDRAGCNEMLNRLHEWMDTRLIDTVAMEAPTDEERERPEFWRYWRVLPRKGRMAIFLGAWTLRSIRDRAGKRTSKIEFERALERIVRLEKSLVDDGALVLKLWLHIPKEVLRGQLELAAEQPQEAWWVQEVDHRVYKHYDRAMKTTERALTRTGTGEAPWTIVESTDARYRDLCVGQALLAALNDRLSRRATPSTAPDPEIRLQQDDTHTILDTIDLTRALDKPAYVDRLKRAQGAIHELTQRARDRGLSSVLVFEGFDASGKGSCIRRLTRAMDAQSYRVEEIAAPTAEELDHHYLWRFWRRLPRDGRVVLFDRSWYGRVLVERVEGLASPAEWQRAYGEINEFEEQIWEHGALLLKFWLHVSHEEQLNRFRARESIPYKKYKITDEDYRNRERRPDYELAVSEMIARTSTPFAPWELIASDDKRWARIRVLETFAEALKKRLKRRD